MENDTRYVVIADSESKCIGALDCLVSAGASQDGDVGVYGGSKYRCDAIGDGAMAPELEIGILRLGADLCWLTVYDNGLYAAKHDPCGVFDEKRFMATCGLGGPYAFFDNAEEADAWMAGHGIGRPADCVVELYRRQGAPAPAGR